MSTTAWAARQTRWVPQQLPTHSGPCPRLSCMLPGYPDVSVTWCVLGEMPLSVLQAMSSNYFLWIILGISFLAVLSKLTGAL